MKKKPKFHLNPSLGVFLDYLHRRGRLQRLRHPPLLMLKYVLLGSAQITGVTLLSFKKTEIRKNPMPAYVFFKL